VLTSTIAATPRLFLRTPPEPTHHRYAGLPEPRSPAGGLSSPAGLHRRPWLARLRRALEQELFVLHYQPIVSLRDGRVSHYEALVRLDDEPDGKLVAPGRFLPAAERYGLIREIDRMVLGKVVALLADRSSAGGYDGGHDGGGNDGERDDSEHNDERDGEHGVRIAINCSSLSIVDGGMLAQIERQLALARVDTARLVIEVTETAAISDMARARDFCAGVQALGCAVALDDFGAGFGSFQYLKHLPFEYLKIDGDFIRGLPSSPQDQLVVKALVELARGMGKRTIAEYVGDQATVELLRDYGVDYAQGFEVGRPHPVSRRLVAPGCVLPI
jgi:EAL domain-containing protein (putative c-di-GMP-specific phosphodiesterase class I)